MTISSLLSGLVLVLSLIARLQAPPQALPRALPQPQFAADTAGARSLGLTGSASNTAVQAAGDFVLQVSQSSNRANPVDLNGQTVSDNIYVFASPDTGATQVRFYLDDPSASGTPVQTEGNAPWDFAGGTGAGANPYDTKKLSNGAHSITASISLSSGGTSVITASFTVSNGVAPTAVPPTPVPPTPVPPTATAAPTNAPAPTATAVAPAPVAEASYSHLVSKSSNRSNAVSLQGQTVSGNIYVYVNPEAGASQVRFYLDNPSASGTPLLTENNAPWDFAGGTSTAANPYDTKKLSNGSHSITASISLTSGGTAVTTSTFTVNNSTATATPAATATATTPPTATPTRQPTATSQSSYSNLVSKSSDRSSASALSGQAVNGNIYVFVSPESGATQVNFYIDNTSASGTPYHSEGNAPWDFNGGTTTAATAYDTRKLSNGAHSITASITLSSGAKTLTTASFTVNNSTATSTPAPTATPGSTSGSIYWGVSMNGVPWDMNKLSTWERDVTGKGVSIVHWGHNWASGSSYRPWSNGNVNNTRGHGSIPMLSWNPDGGDDSRYQLGDIIGGLHDSYIRQFATDTKNWGYPVFLRMMHEMNGSWGYPWQEDANGNSRGQFVQAWKRIVDIFRSVGANNASFVWCPNFIFPSTTTWPTYASLYPGDSYVDWTCLDGYNWGTNRQEGWQTFDQIYNYSYNEVLKVAPSKPMMVGEFGSVEQGGSKANWFTDTLKTQLPSRYPKMRAVVYFNWAMSGVDWRIETSSSASSAWKAGIAGSYYKANTLGSITGKVPVP